MKLETEETHLELDQMRLKLKDKETQLKSANEFLESLTNERIHEREDDRLEILKAIQFQNRHEIFTSMYFLPKFKFLNSYST